jgi:hypothetical protein
MPAKKAAPKNTESTDMSRIWGWVYAVGMVVAGILGGLGMGIPVVTYLLVLAAVLVGLFYFDYEDVAQFGLRVLILIAVQTGLGLLPAPVGPFLNGFFGGWVMFLMPVTLAMILVWFWKMRIAPLFS